MSEPSPDGGHTQRASVPEAKYPLTEEHWARLDRDYTFHAPKADQPERYVALREAARTLFLHICMNTPPHCRDQSLALTHLEEVVFYANAAIARYE
jgi:hypothetical protein